MTVDEYVHRLREVQGHITRTTELSRQFRDALLSGDFARARELADEKNRVFSVLAGLLASVAGLERPNESPDEVSDARAELRRALEIYTNTETELQQTLDVLLDRSAKQLRLRRMVLGAIRGYQEGSALTQPIRRIFSGSQSRYLNEQS